MRSPFGAADQLVIFKNRPNAFSRALRSPRLNYKRKLSLLYKISFGLFLTGKEIGVGGRDGASGHRAVLNLRIGESKMCSFGTVPSFNLLTSLDKFSSSNVSIAAIYLKALKLEI